MNIKQFLKPDWRKILISTIIFLIFFLLFFTESLRTTPSSYVKATACTSEECEKQRDIEIAKAIEADKKSMKMNFYDIQLLIITPFYYIPLRYSEWISVSSWVGITWWTTILELFYCYIISYLIVWIYNKFKVKRK